MHRAERVFLVIAAVGAFVSTVAFALTPFYRTRVAGLDAFELVLAGTVMEAAVLCCEVPTGIVADLWSRKWSVVIGHAGMGVGFLVEAAWPSVAGVLTGQAVWGVSWTFTSGATVAWVTAELGEPDRAALTRLFLRASRAGAVAGLAAVPVAYVLGGWSLRAPIVLGGALSIGLGAWLAAAMGERGFAPAGTADRSTWRHLAGGVGAGIGAIRASRVLVLLAVAMFLAGGASEAYDRYAERHVLDNVVPPAWPGWSGLTWMGVLAGATGVAGIVVPWWFARRVGDLSLAGQRRWIAAMVAVQVAGLLALAATGSFAVAAVTMVVVDRARSLGDTLTGAWIVPLTPPARRATVLSTLGQVDAVSQVTVGPAMGAIGLARGERAAFAASAVLLAPTAAVVLAAGRAGSAGDGDQPASGEAASGKAASGKAASGKPVIGVRSGP